MSNIYEDDDVNFGEKNQAIIGTPEMSPEDKPNMADMII
jgi:hypothetical protein